MKNDVTMVLKIQFDVLVKELRAMREGPRKTYGGRLDMDHGERHRELMAREVSTLDELQPLFNSAVEVLRLNRERSRNWD